MNKSSRLILASALIAGLVNGAQSFAADKKAPMNDKHKHSKECSDKNCKDCEKDGKECKADKHDCSGKDGCHGKDGDAKKE